MGTGCIENRAPSIALLQRNSRVSEKSVVAEVASAIAPTLDRKSQLSQKTSQKILSVFAENHSQALDNVSFLHQVVGMDGVLMLSLPRDNFERFNYAQSMLRKVGITPTKFLAIDANDATPQVLDQGCIIGGSSEHTCGAALAPWNTSTGCISKVEQAIAESHRQALTAALYREHENWTAIFEDDAVPVLPEVGAWDSELKRIWLELPEEVGMIRLGWCEPSLNVSENWTGYGGNWTDNWTNDLDNSGHLPREEIGTFMWTRTATRIGGCTTAYMVHKRIIPDLLRIFPCCSALDSCLEWDYFSKHQTEFINLDVRGSDAYIQQHGDHRFGVAHGVLMQDWRKLGSTRWNDKEGHPMLTEADRAVRIHAKRSSHL